jgi:p-methyltransferase
VINLTLDAIIIADFGQDSLSGSNPLKLELDGRTADIQVVLNYLEHQGEAVLPIEGDDIMSWSSAPKLNGTFLHSYLTKNDFEVELIDSFINERDVFCDLLKNNPHVVIISTTFIYRKKDLRKLVDDIRSLAPDIFIIIGGPFVYLSYLVLERSHDQAYQLEEIQNDFLFFNNDEPSADLYIISLRGEQILCEALDRIKRNQQIDDLPNSARYIGPEYHFTHRIDDISNNRNFFVDWESLPDKIFKSCVVPMQASTGCPYKCAFCNFTKDRRLISVKPLEQLVSELKSVLIRGAKYIWFVDDNFRLGSDDLNSVCQRFVDEDLQIRWMSFIRADALKNIDFELLCRSGCTELQLGLESAELKVLRNMNKKVDPIIAGEVVRDLLAVGINCSCYFVIGFPGETDETVFRTIEFIKSIEYPNLEGILSWSIYPFMLAPMSPIYESEMRKKYGLTGYMHNWEHRTMNSVEAREHVKKAFFAIERSGPIYRGDNQKILHELMPMKRKQFMAKRHELSKLAMENRLEKHDVIKSFTDVFYQ